MDGWISLYRKIQDHWLWKQKRKFSQFEAWISLLFKASHKSRQIMVDGKLTDIKVGELITSEVKLSEEWGWNRSTVRRFLRTLESQKMIHRSATTKYTSIIIENWSSYQIPQQQKQQQKQQHHCGAVVGFGVFLRAKSKTQLT